MRAAERVSQAACWGRDNRVTPAPHSTPSRRPRCGGESHASIHELVMDVPAKLPINAACVLQKKKIYENFEKPR